MVHKNRAQSGENPGCALSGSRGFSILMLLSMCCVTMVFPQSTLAVSRKNWAAPLSQSIFLSKTWKNYFAGGRNIALLNRPILFVPMPLAVFPVLYFLSAALWLHNIPAAIMMTIFGAAHLTVSVQSFR